MLSSLHKTATGTFMKLFLSVIVASFVLWGIGDIFRKGGGNGVAKVGEDRISLQEFDEALKRELAGYRSMLGKNYNPDIIKAMHVPQQVLERLIQQHLIQQEVKSLGLVVPEAHLAEQVRDNPVFADEKGKFDRNKFQNLLASNGLSEKRYLDLLAQETTANLLMQAAFSGIHVTESAAEIAYRFEQEKRSADVIIFSGEAVSDIPEPSDEQLNNYYQENIQQFTSPERRDFTLVTLDKESIAKSISISNEDVLVEYQKQIDNYREPEKREVKQLLLVDEETAKKAQVALASGMAIETAAKEFGALNEEISFGNVPSSGIIPEAEKAVFALEINNYTVPIKSEFGWHIFQVTGITPPRTRPIEEVRKEVENALRQKNALEAVDNLSLTLQDALASGTKIDEAARKVGAISHHFSGISKDGMDVKGRKADIAEKYTELLENVFDLQQGETSSLLEASDGSYYLAYVGTITPQAQQPLSEVKTAAVADWKEAEKNRRLVEFTSGAAKELETKSAEEVAKASHAEVIHEKIFSRNQQELTEAINAPAALTGALFSLSPGKATGAYPLGNGTYAAAKLIHIIPAETGSETAKAGIANAKENLRGVYADEMFRAYLDYLREKHGVSHINEMILQEAVR